MGVKINVLRARRNAAVALLMAATIVTGLVMTSTPAAADAGNPILGTIIGTVVADPSGGGVTVYVRGQWNWLSHNSDCNFDRAATGVGIIWNDPNSPGFTVTKGSVSAGVGVASSTDGNAVDPMVHPVDLGNVPQGYTAGTWQSTTQGYPTNASGDYPSGQTFNDPASNNPNDFASWKGGCGREPLTSTGPSGSAGLGAEGINSACAGGGSCSGHPWGSWGYLKNSGLGYSHHYAQRSDVTTVCANFYDVHGGGKFNSGKMQLPGGAKEITVNGNGDNSIQTNAFNVNQGANCVFFPLITTQATSSGLPTDNIHDTANVSGAPANTTATISFRVYTSLSECSNDAAFIGGTAEGSTTANTSSTGTMTATSNDLTKPVAEGDYFWRAAFTTANASPVLSDCNSTSEKSHVEKIPTTASTAQKAYPQDSATITSTASGDNLPSNGTVIFSLYNSLANCQANGATVYTQTINPVGGTHSATVNTTNSTFAVDASTNGTYYWTVTYATGDTAHTGRQSVCTENVVLTFTDDAGPGTVFP
jgi:hypothetical protein